MLYYEIGDGGVKAAGCAKLNWLWSSVSRFAVGDTLWAASTARRGRLEKVVIKDVIISVSRRTAGRQNFIYQDTFNGLWNEHDLVPYAEAIRLIESLHYARQLDSERLKSCP